MPRESITGNITYSNQKPGHFMKMSMSDISSGVGKKQNMLFSSQISGLSSQRNPLELNQSSYSYKYGGMNIIDQRSSERAIQNWAKFYKKCMTEYRKHRLKKAVMSFRTKNPQRSPAVRKQFGGQLNSFKNPVNKHRSLKPKYAYYPCVRFIQRCLRVKLLKRRLRFTPVPK